MLAEEKLVHREGKAGGMHVAHSRDGTSFSVTSTEQKALLSFALLFSGSQKF